MSDIGFIISTYVINDKHIEILIRCIESIQKYYKEQIVVIVDYKSNKNMIDNIYRKYPNVLFEFDTSELNAENLPFLYFLKKKYFQKAIILHDSMWLINKLTDISKINTFQYIWHFENHRNEWAIIQEPITPFTMKHNIKTHDDLNRYIINNVIIHEGFKQYCLNKYDNKNEWAGCVGCRIIIDYDFMVNLNKNTEIIDLFSKLNEKRERMAAESIFSLACQYVLGKDILYSYDGLHWDGKGNGHNYNGYYFKKISLGR